jgi:hypothetical protein
MPKHTFNALSDVLLLGELAAQCVMQRRVVALDVTNHVGGAFNTIATCETLQHRIFGVNFTAVWEGVPNIS